MSRLLGQRAVVIGAGIGGLSMAGALAKYFERVEIFERDRLTTSAASRSGTPRDRHPHGLLAGGLRALTEVAVDLSYATAVVPIPANAPPDWKLVLTLPDPPALARNASLLPMEGGRWIILIADRGATARLEAWDSFLEASRSLITPTLYSALRYAKPPDGIRHYRFLASYWMHFERVPRLPCGVLPVADALCRFNPIYGQGMSAAAQQARLLRDILGRAAVEPDPIAAAQAGFMAEVASVLETPWSMSTSADLAFPGTRGERPDNFEDARRFEAALFRAVIADPVVHRAMMEVGQLLQPQRLLQEPDIMRRIEAVSPQAAA
jgi:2-polyprenyl-6-methoxyphenol hydroxylase-like FAD-dependent oxidoreductase